jgi:hypothetical protein
MMKICSNCKTEKDVSNFYLHKSMKDGLQSWCKECESIKSKVYNASLSPEKRAAIAARSATPERKMKAKARRATPEAKAKKKVQAATPEYKLTAKKWALFKYYNLTLEQLDIILARQGGHCAICSATEPGGKGAWHVDHDHSCCPSVKTCGKCIRGLLCSSCNLGIGHLKDNVAILENAINYLRGPFLTITTPESTF